jgi:hypothetical protein
MMFVKALGVTLALASSAGVAFAQSGTSADPKMLVKLWTKEYEVCRGSYPNDPRRDAACAAMGTYVDKLHAIGWCYGKEGQIRAEMDWHKCGPGSLRD